MLKIPVIKLRRKTRKYPIKRDSYGRSARQRAFDVFENGKTAAEVAVMVPISARTARRYFADWKKLPGNVEVRYRLAKAVRKGSQEFSPETIDLLGEHLGMSNAEVVERLQKPWGLKQLLMGKWPNRRKEKIVSKGEARLRAALELINFVEHSGMTPEEIREVTSALIRQAGKHKAEQRH